MAKAAIPGPPRESVAPAEESARNSLPRPTAVVREPSTGARNVVRALEELGVDTIFGLPGGAILPTYDPLYDSATLRHILVRHE